MNSKLALGILFGWFFATNQGYAQEDRKPPSQGTDLLYGTKYLAYQANAGNVETQRNIAKYITDSRHSFVVAPEEFIIGEQKQAGIRSVEKAAGSLSVFSSQKVRGHVSITDEAKLPLQQDLSFIQSLYPVLEAQNIGVPDPARNTRVRAYTTWYNLRFEGTRLDAGNLEFRPLTEDSFLSAYAKLGYVEIDSKPTRASITVVGHDGWSETRDTGFLPEGEVSIVVSKDGFKTREAKETIRVKGNNTFIYSLQPATPDP
jgi:hypothetical protein